MQATSAEIWKPLLGYEGHYEGSSLGRIKSVERVIEWRTTAGKTALRRINERVLSTYPSDGYPQVMLSKGNVKQTGKVHILICEAFHGPRPEGHVVAHNNGIRTDCRSDNLRWATHRENQADMRAHGTLRLGQQLSWTKLTPEQVEEVRKCSAQALAERFGVTPENIRMIWRRTSWKYME